MADAGLKNVLKRRHNKIMKAKAQGRGKVASLAEVYKICSPHLEPPDHLGPYVRALEACALGGTPVELTFHAPPQHGKSEAAKHALIFAAIVRPGLRHAYATYNSERATKGISVPPAWTRTRPTGIYTWPAGPRSVSSAAGPR